MKLSESKSSSLFHGLTRTTSSPSGVRDMNNLNADASLADLGLDSLMGVEIRQILERDYDIVMAMREIRQLTINKLRDLVNKPGGSHGIKRHA